MYNKEAEFRTWLVEERMINPETITKDQNKKEFAKFVEDFNTGMYSHSRPLFLSSSSNRSPHPTATLPHKKYYDMYKYEREMNMLRSGETLPLEEETYDPNKDLAAHKSSLRKPVAETESYLSVDQLKELRRVQQERVAVSNPDFSSGS
jgi:hypothetical protein